MTIGNVGMDSPDYFKSLISRLSPYRLSTEEMDHPLDPTRNVPMGYTSWPSLYHPDFPEIQTIRDSTPLLVQYMNMVDKGESARPAPFDWGTGNPQYLSEVLSESLPPQSLPYINMGAEAQRRSKVNVDGNVFTPDGAALPDAPMEMFRPGGGMDDAVALDPLFHWTNRAMDPTPDRFIEEEELKAVDVMHQLASVGQQRELKTIWDELDDVREGLTFWGSFPRAGDPSFVTQARKDPQWMAAQQKIKSLTYRLISSMDYKHPQWYYTNLGDPGAAEQGRVDVWGEHPSLSALNSLTGFDLSFEDSQDPTKVSEAVDDFVDAVWADASQRQILIRSLAVGKPVDDEFDVMSLTPSNPITELKIYDKETGEFRLMEVAEVLGSPEYQERAEKYRQDMAYRDNLHSSLTERHEFGPARSTHTETWAESIKAVLKDRYNRSDVVSQARTPWGGGRQVLHRLATGQEHEDSMDRRQEALTYSEEAKHISKSRGPKPGPVVQFPDTIRDWPDDWSFPEEGLGEKPWDTAGRIQRGMNRARLSASLYSPMSAAYQPPIMDTWGWWLKPPSERVQATALALMFPHKQSMEEYAERESEEMRVLSQYLSRDVSAEIDEMGDLGSSEMLLAQTEKLNYISDVLDRYIKQGEAGDDAFYAAQPFIQAGLLDSTLTSDNYLDAMKELSGRYKTKLVENAAIYDQINSPMRNYDMLMVAGMNEGLGTSFVNINQVNELVFATVLDKDKFSRGERLNILRTWNMAHTAFVKQIEDNNIEGMMATVDVGSWNNRSVQPKSRSIWGYSGLGSNESTRDAIFEGNPAAVSLAQVYLNTMNNAYIENLKQLYPNAHPETTRPSPFNLEKQINWGGLTPVEAHAAIRTLGQVLTNNPLDDGVPVQIKNFEKFIDDGMSWLGDQESLQGEGPEVEARRLAAGQALLYVGYFGDMARTNPDIRQIASDFGFTKQELIAADLVMTLAAQNNPNLGVYETDIMLDAGRATDLIDSINDETRKLYRLLSTTFEGSPAFDRGVEAMLMQLPSDMESIPWAWSTEWGTDFLTKVTEGKTQYDTLTRKLGDLKISLYEDEDKARQGIANMLGVDVTDLENGGSKLWNFFSEDSWEMYTNKGVNGLNLAALSIMKSFSLDSRMRERMGMLVYAARTEYGRQSIHGLVTTAAAVTLSNNNLEVMGTDTVSKSPVVASSQLHRTIVENALANREGQAGKTLDEWIGIEWNTSTPENGMLGWASWLNEEDSEFMKGTRANFSPDQAEYQAIISVMPGNTGEEREKKFVEMRERAIAGTIQSYSSPEVAGAYNERGASTNPTDQYTPYKTDIHLDILRRMMLDDAWPDRPFVEGGPAKHFQKGLYVDNDGGMGTFGGELVPGTTDTYVYRQNVGITPLDGMSIMDRASRGDSAMGHVTLKSTVTLEGEDWTAQPINSITLPWILFSMEQDEEKLRLGKTGIPLAARIGGPSHVMLHYLGLVDYDDAKTKRRKELEKKKKAD